VIAILNRVKEQVEKRSSVYNLEDIKKLLSVVDKASVLSAKLAAITVDEDYRAVFEKAFAHGLRYKGPNWHDELEEMKEALKKMWEVAE